MAGRMFSTLPNEFEPLRKDLFSLEFPPDMNIGEQFLVSAARPTVTNNRNEIQYKNLPTYYKGKTSFETIDVSFRDAIGPGVYQKLQQWQREHTDFATGRGGYAATYKKQLTLNMEDPTGAPVQSFTLFGVFLESLNGNDLSMDDDGIANVSITISFDAYELEF